MVSGPKKIYVVGDRVNYNDWMKTCGFIEGVIAARVLDHMVEHPRITCIEDLESIFSDRPDMVDCLTDPQNKFPQLGRRDVDPPTFRGYNIIEAEVVDTERIEGVMSRYDVLMNQSNASEKPRTLFRILYQEH